ncbi:MAG: modification methylase, partial [Synergistaceae bacterium]|nr:modification methylase [Synergistaceae bacterium]
MQKNLQEAKNAKNDEFYTQYNDIQREINAYLEFDQDAFRGKTILLPCDDPDWSNFTRFFAQNFEYFGLKKLISTSYAVNSKRYKEVMQLSLFETNSPKYDPSKTDTNGKIFILDRAANGSHRLDIHDLKWDYLQGDGDFRSPEVKALRDEADIIVTNPPFSLFREFLSWIIEADKKFLIIGNKNAITYKEVFPLIKDNKIWAGARPMGADMYFQAPQGYIEEILDKERMTAVALVGDEYLARSPSIWFTNLDHC